MKLKHLIWLLLMALHIMWVRGDDFFDIDHLKFYQKQPGNGPALFNDVQQMDENNQPVAKKVFAPFLEVRVTVKEAVQTSAIFAKAYFYDQDKNLLQQVVANTLVDRSTGENYDWRGLLPKDKEQIILIAVPDSVLEQQNWSAVVVLGDSKGVDAQMYPDSAQLTDYDYPEKDVLEDKNGPPLERKAAMDPLIEHVVQTGNPDQPQITLFMRPPPGMTDASEAKGVLGMCVLGKFVRDVRRQLQGIDSGNDVGGILKFAADHKLIIVCWGCDSLWDPQKNWDDLSPDKAWEIDKAFDQVAGAWANGIQYFVKEYGLPQNNYLLWGESGSAQYACRLALRKPEYFLAIHAHIPSSFDKPTPEGSRVLWCLTTGELESGHARSLRFYKQCRQLGYPIIYKAVTGIGHEWSPISADLGEKFFEYALTVADQRRTYDEKLKDPLAQPQMNQSADGPVQPWLDSFSKPAFVGDIVNQEVFPYDQQGMIPAGLRTSLPTKDIADAWNK